MMTESKRFVLPICPICHLEKKEDFSYFCRGHTNEEVDALPRIKVKFKTPILTVGDRAIPDTEDNKS